MLRHAAATCFDAQLDFARDALRLEFHDDGRGFDPSRRNDGFGLLGMRERVQRMGGQLAIDSAPGAGSTIRLNVPLPAA